MLAYRAPASGAPRELYDLCFGLLAISGVPTAVALGTWAALALRPGPLPAWSGWLGAVGAIAHLVIAASFPPRAGFLSLEGGVIVAVPVTLFARLLGASVTCQRLGPADRDGVVSTLP